MYSPPYTNHHSLRHRARVSPYLSFVDKTLLCSIAGFQNGQNTGDQLFLLLDSRMGKTLVTIRALVIDSRGTKCG